MTCTVNHGQHRIRTMASKNTTKTRRPQAHPFRPVVSTAVADSAFSAVFFDFGGVVLTSPFEAFERYERTNGLPVGLIRDINATNPDDNAWARLERNEVDVDGFVPLFEAEARVRGLDVDGTKVIAMLAGTVRSEMVDAIDRIKAAGMVTACLTNNFVAADARRVDDRTPEERKRVAEVLERFDFIVESSVVGVRKPEPEFYLRALELADVPAAEVVFLDDLGVNLKPARAMGMTTIKVVDPTDALTELQAHLGIDLGVDA